MHRLGLPSKSRAPGSGRRGEMPPSPGMHHQPSRRAGPRLPSYQVYQVSSREGSALSSPRHTFPGCLVRVRHRGRSKGSAWCPAFMSPSGHPGPASCRATEGLGWIPAPPLPDGNPDFSEQLLLPPCPLLPPSSHDGSVPCVPSPPTSGHRPSLKHLLFLVLLTLVCTWKRFSPFI